MPRGKLSLSLFTDLYELTMAQAFWQSGMSGEATFSLFFRHYPPDRAYFVFAGLQDILDYLQQLRFTSDDIAFLRSSNLFDEGFLGYLAELQFTGSVRAMPEGAIAFADEPVIEVTAPIVEAQIPETFLVNQANVQSLLATKTSRVVHASRGRSVVDFAARRTHGPDTAGRLARVSYMTGFTGTSNVLAGGHHHIPTFGTMAHSFITAFHDETDAFRQYAESFPNSSTFLVDTYDTLSGTHKAIEVAREMRQKGHELRAIRLDSGDLLDLSRRCRALLDEAGFGGTQVFASGGLDEFGVDELLRAGSPIDGFGVGTKVGVSADAPWTDCVYKLVRYDGRPTLKLSSEKETLPGPKQVYRIRDEAGGYRRDVIARADEHPPDDEAQPLLREVMRDGKLVAPLPSLDELRERFRKEFARLHDRHKALRRPERYDVTISEALAALRSRVSEEVMRRQKADHRLER